MTAPWLLLVGLLPNRLLRAGIEAIEDALYMWDDDEDEEDVA